MADPAVKWDEGQFQAPNDWSGGSFSDDAPPESKWHEAGAEAWSDIKDTAKQVGSSLMSLATQEFEASQPFASEQQAAEKEGAYDPQAIPRALATAATPFVTGPASLVTGAARSRQTGESYPSAVAAEQGDFQNAITSGHPEAENIAGAMSAPMLPMQVVGDVAYDVTGSPLIGAVAQGAAGLIPGVHSVAKAHIAHVGDLVHATAKSAGASDTLAAALKQSAMKDASKPANVLKVQPMKKSLAEHINTAVDSLSMNDLQALSPTVKFMKERGDSDTKIRGALRESLQEKGKQFELTPEQMQPPGADALDEEAPPAAPTDPAAARVAELDQQIKAEPNKLVQKVMQKRRDTLAGELKAKAAEAERADAYDKLRQKAAEAAKAGDKDASELYLAEAEKLKPALPALYDYEAPGEGFSVDSQGRARGEPTSAEPAQTPKVVDSSATESPAQKALPSPKPMLAIPHIPNWRPWTPMLGHSPGSPIRMTPEGQAMPADANPRTAALSEPGSEVPAAAAQHPAYSHAYPNEFNEAANAEGLPVDELAARTTDAITHLLELDPPYAESLGRTNLTMQELYHASLKRLGEIYRREGAGGGEADAQESEPGLEGIQVGEGETIDVAHTPEPDADVRERIQEGRRQRGEAKARNSALDKTEVGEVPPPPVAEPIKGVDATGDVPLGGGKLANGDTAIDQGIPRHIWVPEAGKWADAHAEIHAHENGEVGQQKPGEGDNIDRVGYGGAHDRFGNHATKTELTRQGFDTPELQAAYARALQPYLDEAKARAERGEAFDIHPKLDKRVYEQSSPGLSLTKYRQKAARTSAKIGKQGVEALRAKVKASVQHSNAAEPVAGMQEKASQQSPYPADLVARAKAAGRDPSDQMQFEWHEKLRREKKDGQHSNAAEPVAGGADAGEHTVQPEGPKEEAAGTVRPEPKEAQGIGDVSLPEKEAGPTAAAKAAARTEQASKEVEHGVARKFADWLGGVVKRHEMQAAGQDILDGMEERGESPSAIAKKFWDSTYFKLPGEVQARFKSQLEVHSGFNRGTMPDITSGIENLDLPNSVEALEGTERGFVALMREANRRFEEGEVANATQEGVKPGNGEQQHQGTGEQRPAAEAGGGNRVEPGAPKLTEEKPGTASAARDVSKMSDDKLRSYARGWGIKDAATRPRGELEAEVRARQDGDPEMSAGWESVEGGLHDAHTPASFLQELRGEVGDKGLINLRKKGLLNIVHTKAGLPEELRNRIGDKNPAAIYDSRNGAAWFIASNITKGEARGVLMHEIAEHHGMEDMLGSKYDKYISDLRALRNGGSAEAKAAWDLVRKVYTHLDENSKQFMKEVAARLIQNSPKLPWVRRVLNEVRAWAYKNFGFGKLDENTLRGLAEQSLRRIQTDEPKFLQAHAQKAAEAQPQFSLSNRTTGIAHKYAEQRGTEAERGEYDFAGRMDEARRWLQAGNDPNSIFTDTSAKLDDRIARGRAHDDVLVAKFNAAADKYGEDSTQAKAADQAEREWVARLKPLQTESGSAMQMQQGASEPDVGSYRGITKAISDVTGKEPTEGQKTKAKEVSGKVKAATDDLDEARNKAFDEGTGAAAPDAEFTDLSNKVKTGENTVANAAKLIRNRKRAGRAPDEIAEDVAGAGVDADTMEQGWQRVRQKLPELGLPDAKPEKLIADAAAKRDAAIKAHPPGEAWTPEHAAALWKAAKEQFDKGTKDFDRITKALSDQYGMSYEDVANGLASNKTMRKMTDELYLKQAEQRHIVNAAKNWVEEQKHPIMAAVYRVPNLFFNLATFGHGTVWPITHAAPMIFYPPAWPALAHTWKESFKMLGNGFAEGSGYHEELMGRMKSDPLWARGRRYGLDNDPGSYSEYQNPDAARFFKRIGQAGNDAFDALKLFRQMRFNTEWGNLPEEMKTDEGGRLLVDMINHATGSTRGDAFVSNRVTRALLFAPKLVKSQFQYLYTDTGKATYNVFKGETPEARYMAKKELRQKLHTIGTAFALLELNQAFLSSSGSDQKVNLTDPSKADWMEFKAGGMRIPIGGAMMSNVRMVADLITIPRLASTEVHGESPYHAAGKRLEDYARGKASPMMQKVIDFYDKADYSGKPLPWSDKKVPAYLQREGVDRYTYPEYLAENFSPIPVEDFFKEIVRSQGASDDQSADWLGALGIGGLVFSTGIHPLPDIKK